MKIRTAYMVQFSDGTYLAKHMKPSARDGREWYKFGRKVQFEKGRIYPTKGAATQAFCRLNDPTAKVIEVCVSEPYITVPETTVMEDVYA